LLYIITEITLLLMLALLLGVLVGWLLFKAGRQSVSNQESERLARERHRLRSERDTAANDREILLADRDRAFAERDHVVDQRDRIETDYRVTMDRLTEMTAERDRLLDEFHGDKLVAVVPFDRARRTNGSDGDHTPDLNDVESDPGPCANGSETDHPPRVNGTEAMAGPIPSRMESTHTDF